MFLRLFGFLLLSALALHAAEIRGKIVNVVGGEALERVEVSLLETGASTNTADDGTFTIPNVAPGSYTLRLNAVGYRLATVSISLSSQEESKDFSLTLTPDNFRRTEKVEVTADVFHATESPAVVETNLSSSEIRETSTVIADDPFRALQSLPGVSPSANNDFFAEFSVMGAPFGDVGIYLDDVLVQRPFHGLPNQPEGASLSLLTSETVEEMKLLPVAYPVKYGDAIGAALDIHTRDGSFARRPMFRVSIGMANTEVLGEGGLGRSKRGSWLASARKSYLGYLLQNRLHQNYVDVGFYDAALKLTYDVAPNHNLNLYVLGGHSDATEIPAGGGLTIGEFKTGATDFTIARAGWRWSVTHHLLLDTHAAYIRQPNNTRDPFGHILTTNGYSEWLGGGRVSWSWNRESVLESGWTLRRLRDVGYAALYDTSTGQQEQFNISDGVALRNTGYVQHSTAFLDNRLHLTGGVRWDAMQNIGTHPFSEQGSIAFRAASRTVLQFGAGHYAQMPTLQQPNCFLADPMPDRSTHFTAAVEQRLEESTRLQLQFFDRQNEQFLALHQGYSCSSSQIVGGSHLYQRNYSRGAQVVLQRRSSNRLSGWLGYTLVFARQRYYSITLPQIPDVALYFDTPYYPTLEDQRHSLHLFASYRLKPTLNLSGKLQYGSGFPVPSGLFGFVNGQYVSLGLNETRLGAYQRLDVRADKDWAFRRWKLTLYGEVLNLTNHDNLRYVQTGAIDVQTGKATVITEQGLPITPTAGLVFQF